MCILGINTEEGIWECCSSTSSILPGFEMSFGRRLHENNFSKFWEIAHWWQAVSKSWISIFQISAKNSTTSQNSTHWSIGLLVWHEKWSDSLDFMSSSPFNKNKFRVDLNFDPHLKWILKIRCRSNLFCILCFTFFFQLSLMMAENFNFGLL